MPNGIQVSRPWLETQLSLVFHGKIRTEISLISQDRRPSGSRMFSLSSLLLLLLLCAHTCVHGALWGSKSSVLWSWTRDAWFRKTLMHCLRGHQLERCHLNLCRDLSWDGLSGFSDSLWLNDSLHFPTLLAKEALISASYYFSFGALLMWKLFYFMPPGSFALKIKTCSLAIC